MNVNIYYKGQTVSIKVDHNFDLKYIYECSLPKFEQHFYKELQLFGANVRLRSRSTNNLLKFSDTICAVLPDNDTIIIEPKENLTSSSPNIHAPKRYDLAKIDNTCSPLSYKSSEFPQIKNINNQKATNDVKQPHPMEIKYASKAHRYQKLEQSHNVSKNVQGFNTNFERNDLRRSLGGSVVPLHDAYEGDVNRLYNETTKFDSDSSVSDFHSSERAAGTKRPQQLNNLPSKLNNVENYLSISKSAPASPTKPKPPQRSPHTHVSMLNAYTVRTIGNKINISIVKKPNFGLGFTIVTRDNQVLYGSAADIANSVVILVNKILPNGGAALDNRLRPGDRLLEINGVPITSHKEATEKLRSIPENERVNLVVSRVEQCDIPEKDYQSRDSLSSQLQITFEIPLNQHQKDRQQLGLNIQYRDEQSSGSMGPGIYIHSILANSMASQQGGLRVDDKLIGINDHNLDNMSVEETIGQLKHIMQHNAVLAVTVCRTVTVEQTPSIKEMHKKDQNYFLLPNKISLDRKSTQLSNSRTLSRNNRCSSDDSLSLEDNTTYQFVRDSSGRRSMSDKRKAHEDASQYRFYQESRLADDRISDDRMYSTLPTASRLKKMSTNQAPFLPNKTQAPVKPSQIKQLNTSKTQHDPTIMAPKVPKRSISLRNSPVIEQINQSYDPKLLSQNLTADQQPGFNRALNNSFKRAVHKSYPDTDEYTSNHSNYRDNVPSMRREPANPQSDTHIDNQYPIYNPRQDDENIPRSYSVKTSEDKKKNFNLKSFLTFTPNVTRTRSVLNKDKATTLSLNQVSLYHTPLSNSTPKQIVYSPSELPLAAQSYDDPVIVDSTKRVLEWQMKNDDVISKENRIKEQQLLHNLIPFGTGNIKNKSDTTMVLRNPAPSRQINMHETDPYDTIDAVQHPKQKYGQTRSSRSNSQSNVTSLASQNGAATPTNRITYQTSPPNDIYATINKGDKRERRSSREHSGAFQGYSNKYRF